MRYRPILPLLVAAVVAFALALPAAASSSNKWRIQCSEGAKSDGELVFRVDAGDTAALDIVVAIPKGTSENQVARRIRDAFKAKLDSARFRVEVDDGEDVLVKAVGNQKNFTLTLASNSVKAVRIDLDRE